MANYNKGNPSRVISWLQQVQEADPNYRQESLRPWVYEFSNGRRFVDDPEVYTKQAP